MKRWVREIKAVGWDLDGTLYPADQELSAEIKRLRYEEVADKQGWGVDKAKDEFERTHQELGSSTKALYEFGIDGIEFYVRMWDLVKLEKYIKKDVRVVRTLEKINQAGLKQFMISNSNRLDQIERKLGLIGLTTKSFDLIVSTVELGVVKPDPEPFLYALEKLELVPEECLFVGDRLWTDVMGAKSVRMKTCLVYGDAREADIRVPGWEELDKVLEEVGKEDVELKAKGEDSGEPR